MKSMQAQHEQVKQIQTRIPDISASLSVISGVEQECVAANIEENDYTVFSCQDLQFELELLVQSIAKKISFIENQV